MDYTDGMEIPAPPHIEIIFVKAGVVSPVQYEELCESCTSAVEGYLANIVKAKKKPVASSEDDESSMPPDAPS